MLTEGSWGAGVAPQNSSKPRFFSSPRTLGHCAGVPVLATAGCNSNTCAVVCGTHDFICSLSGLFAAYPCWTDQRWRVIALCLSPLLKALVQTRRMKYLVEMSCLQDHFFPPISMRLFCRAAIDGRVKLFRLSLWQLLLYPQNR